ncbi:hypothetical protein MASR2M8_23930 [Opitutaceae bacterium]
MSAAEPREKLSKTPSWIMVGFLLGVIAVLGFQHEMGRSSAAVEAAAIVAPPPPAPAPVENVTALTDRPSLAVIEAVFAEWGGFARWAEDRTEVALWNSTTGGFTDFFEIVRTADGLYVRSINRLTRPLTEADPPAEAPLRFTEPPEEREARRAGRLSPQINTEGIVPWREKETQDSPPRPVYLPPPAPPAGEPKI